MVLWIVFAVMTAGVLMALLWPLARRDAGSVSGQAFDAEIYRDQLREIDLDADRGLITAEDAEAARNEVSRRLLAGADLARNTTTTKADDAAVADTAPGAGSHPSQLSNGLFYATALLIPVFAVSLYLIVGNPGMPGQPFAERAAPPVNDRDVKSLIAQVEAILRKNPQDGRGWAVIAPVYVREGRYNDAVDAYRRALGLNKPDAELMSGYGEALRLANDGVISEEARKIYAAALKLDNTMIVPKIALALARAQDGQFAGAAADLRQLLKKGGKDAPWRTMVTQQAEAFEAQAATIRRRVAEAANAGRKSGAKVETGKAPGGPSAEDIKDAQSMTRQDRMAMINTMVEGLAERMKTDKQNLPGWLRLIQSYKVLSREEDAVAALKSAREAFKNDSASLAKLDALAKNLGLGA